MSKRWSKLQKEFNLLIDDNLNLQLHCRVYRMGSQNGSTDLPRYWLTLNKEVIWDYPKDFIKSLNPNHEKVNWYPYDSDISAISELIREYIDTPKALLFSKDFENDHWQLTDILKAADKRIGKRRLPELLQLTDAIAVKKVIQRRLAGKVG